MKEIGLNPSNKCIDTVWKKSGERGRIALTRPRARASSSTRWAVNMKRKYRVASSAMVLMITGSLSPSFFDRVMK
jgi:hypothetical protein